MSNIAAAATKDIEEFLKLYDQLAKIEGSAAHLYGDLFEFIVGVAYREFLPASSIEIGGMCMTKAEEKDLAQQNEEIKDTEFKSEMTKNFGCYIDNPDK